jgi:hypothetical protein
MKVGCVIVEREVIFKVEVMDSDVARSRSYGVTV